VRQLLDRYQRAVKYLRVSITDLCNLRCVYCRPPEGVKLITHDEILRYEEILTVITVARDMGVRKIRVTGGEPLVRRGALEFISRLTSLEGIEDVGLTTNGVLLPSMAKDLKSVGLTRINISLDSLRPEIFRRITRSDRLADVLAGVELVMELGFHPVKINVVLLHGINEGDVPAFARMTLEKPLDIRFIERMPFGSEPGASASPSFSALAALDMIRRELGDIHPEQRQPLDGPATMYRLDGALGRIGVIDPMTGHFCGTCNRMRLTARGALRPCLLNSQEFDLRRALRNGSSCEDVAAIIQTAVLAKPMGDASGIRCEREGMYLIGG
jgi:cyclic pyranopterin phosphate synthase